MTNNRNRTVAEVRHAFSKYGVNLGTDGSVSYLFKKQGQIMFAPGINEEGLMERVLDMNVEDVVMNDDKSVEIITLPDHFLSVKQGLVNDGFHPAEADV